MGANFWEVPLNIITSGRKLKLDLHTHCNEATGFQRPDERIATLIAQQIRARGLDGIAVTPHNEAEYAFLLQEVMARCHPDLVIIPGKERRWDMEHVVELFLPDGAVFRFIAHPGNLWGARNLTPADGIHGIEIANGLQFVHEEKVRAFATENDLIMLSNSDAHTIPDIGYHYSKVDLAELSARARR
jgi:hypothetical protein